MCCVKLYHIVIVVITEFTMHSVELGKIQILVLIA